MCKFKPAPAIAAAASMAFLVAGCVGQTGGNWIGVNTASDVSTLPEDYKQIVEARLKSDLKDPYSAIVEVGDGFTASCMIGIYGKFHGWVVPVRYNAKNSYGGYVGEQIVYYWFANGTLTRLSYDLNFCP